MRLGLRTACLRALLTVLATAVVLFLMHAAYWWIWIYRNGPGPEQELFNYKYFLFTASALIAVQLPVLLLGAITAAVLRGRYRIGPGLLLFLLTVTVPNIRGPSLRLFVYVVVLPLVVSALQWLLPEGRNADPSNNALQDDAVLPAASRRSIQRG